MNIRPAADADRDAIFAIIDPVLKAGQTYAIARDLTPAQTLDYWFAPSHQVFVAEDDSEILGTYYLMANQAGGGAHIANCGYMTASAAQGRGIARAMCVHSQDIARDAGFLGIQFNHVVSTNVGAVALWQKLGFAIVGTLPGAFNHPTAGYVDSFVMFKAL